MGKISILFVAGLALASLVVSSFSIANEKRKEVDIVFSKLASVLPEESILLALPYPENLGTYGNVSQSLIDSTGMIGGKIMRVSAKKSKNAYDSGIVLAINKPVLKGDVIYLTFFAQAIETPESSNTIKIEGIGLQQSSAPYASLFSNTLQLSKKLESFAFSGKADKDYAPGELQVTFQIATGEQVIGMGPVYVFTVGSEINASTLPYLTKNK